MCRWLIDGKSIREYKDNYAGSENREERLKELLSGKELELFEGYVETREDCSEAERRMLFSQGVYIGLRLGVLCAWK